MTGSGKTGLCIALLEEAAIDGIPAIVIDPKGDLANLMLAFPDLRAEDFLPWINEDDARRKGLSPEDYAATAGRALEEGPRRVGRGRRPHSPLQGRGRRRRLHAGQRGRARRLGAQVVRGAPAGGPRRRRAPARAREQHGDQLARPPRHRRRSHQEPRAHPDLEPARHRLAGRARPRPGRADPGDPDAADGASRRGRPRVVLSIAGAVRARDAAQQPARRAGLRRLDARASRSTSAGC